MLRITTENAVLTGYRLFSITDLRGCWHITGDVICSASKFLIVSLLLYSSATQLFKKRNNIPSILSEQGYKCNGDQQDIELKWRQEMPTNNHQKLIIMKKRAGLALQPPISRLLQFSSFQQRQVLRRGALGHTWLYSGQSLLVHVFSSLCLSPPWHTAHTTHCFPLPTLLFLE